MKKMIFIRADANAHIGIGHVMRCRSIACAFEKFGEEIIFIIADHSSAELLQNYQVKCLGTAWNDMLSEVDKLSSLIDAMKPTLLLVDSYYVSNEYFDAIRRHARIAYIDDQNAKEWNVDYIINYNIYSNVFDYSAYKKETQLMLGTQYIPLRSDFLHLPKHIIKPVSDVFISAGGTDPEHIVEQIMDRICPLYQNITFHFVVSKLNPRLESIIQLKRDNAVLYIDEKNMSSLMMNCDMAISAAGVTLYELCSAGVPTITYILADNQIMAANEFDKRGIIINCGDCRNDDSFWTKIMDRFSQMINDEGLRATLSLKMQTVVDGKGADRIVMALLAQICN